MPSMIGWTQETLNFIVGCTKVSPGCLRCYAIKEVHRMAGNPNEKVRAANADLTVLHGGKPQWTNRVRFLPERLQKLYRWRKPKLIFVNSLSDLFHEDVPLAVIQQAFQVMADVPRHSYQILTKRPERLVELAPMLPWPSQIWMGVSVESEEYLHRIDLLRQVPAAVRFLSLEPLLGPLPSLDLTGIGWVIVGAESGSGARPMEDDWVREIRDRCKADGRDIPFFFKQRATAKGKKITHPVLDGRAWEEYPE